MKGDIDSAVLLFITTGALWVENCNHRKLNLFCGPQNGYHVIRLQCPQHVVPISDGHFRIL